MDVLYTRFDPSAIRDADMERMMKLFLELLGHTGGDVDAAMRWMEYLWKRHNFFEGKLGIGDFKAYLDESGYVEKPPTGKARLSAKGERRIRSDAFEEIFSKLRPDALGGHRAPAAGLGGEALPETRSFQYGDSFRDVNFGQSIRNTLVRTGDLDLTMNEEDLDVHEREHLTNAATVIAIDISHSMTLYGEDRITPAKKVAMALAELIQTKYPKDTLDVVLFGDEAFLVPPKKIAYITNGEFHTNTKAGLDLALRVLRTRRPVNKQIFLITDGKPTAIHEAGRIYKNPSWYLDPKVVNRTIESALECRRKGVVITTFMLTSDPHLKDFVEKLSRANKGRAFYASADDLGSFVLEDFVRNRRKRM